MADRASVDSGESVSTSEDYEIIPPNTLNVKFSYIIYCKLVQWYKCLYYAFLEMWR